MSDETPTIEDLIARARGGDEDAFAELFGHFRKRLKQMVKLRLDRRLYGRLDESDVLQDAYLTAREKLAAYSEKDDFPVFLWLRLVVGEKLTDLHRHHLGTRMRDADREVSIYRGPMPEVSSVALAARLLGKLTTPSMAAVRAESKLQLQEALNRMDPIDREVLTLRHFEGLSNSEVARLLDLSPTASSNRYVRALERMKAALDLIRNE